jgi:hypothetical protein
MRNLETELKDIHSRSSLWKFVRLHPLRDRLCLRDIFISHVTKIRKSWSVDRLSSHSLGLLQQCLREYGQLGQTALVVVIVWLPDPCFLCKRMISILKNERLAFYDRVDIERALSIAD